MNCVIAQKQIIFSTFLKTEYAKSGTKILVLNKSEAFAQFLLIATNDKSIFFTIRFAHLSQSVSDEKEANACTISNNQFEKDS